MNEGIDMIHPGLFETGRNSFVDFSGHRERFWWYVTDATHVFMCMAWFDYVDPTPEYPLLAGRRVRIILNNSKELHNRYHDKRRRLNTANAQIRVHHDPKQTMHCKFVVFMNQRRDWQWVWHGSYNMTMSGDRGIDQMTTSIDPMLTKDYFDFFADLWHQSIPLDTL